MGGPKHLWSGDWQRESDAAHDRLRPRTPQPSDTEPAAQSARAPGRRRRVRALRLGIVAGLLLIGGVAWALTAVLGSSGHKSPAATAAAAPGAQTTPQTIPQQTIPQRRLPPGGGIPQTIPQPIPPQGTTPQGTTPQGTPTPTTPHTTPTPTTPQQGQTSTQSSPNMVVGPIVTWLGMQIETLTPNLVVIDTVSLGSAADRAGLEPGDQILSVAGRPLSSATGIISAIKGLPAGHRVPIVVGYGSSPSQQIDLPLGAAPTTSP